MSIKSFIGLSDASIKSVSNVPVERIKTILGSGLNRIPFESDLLTIHTGERVDYDLTESLSGLNAKIIPGMATMVGSGDSRFIQTDLDLSGQTDVDITTYLYKETGYTIAMGQRDGATLNFYLMWYSNESIYVGIATTAALNIIIPSISAGVTRKIRIKYLGSGATNADRLKVWIDDVEKVLSFEAGDIPAVIPTITAKWQFFGVNGATYNTGGAIGETSISIDGTLAHLYPLCEGYYQLTATAIDLCCDVIGGKHGVWQGQVVNYKHVAGSGSNYMMKYGYSVYYTYDASSGVEKQRVVPNGIDGNALTKPNALADWMLLKTVAGNLTKYNFAPAIIDFDPLVSTDAKLANFDRSNTTIFAEAARTTLAGYYVATTPYRWHSSQLNRKDYTAWYNTGYKWKLFINATPNSVFDTALLNEIYNYSTDKTGTEITTVLNYCKEGSIVTADMVAGKVYETRDVYYKYVDEHIDCIRGNTYFKFADGTIYLSKDGGLTYPYSAVVAGLDRIQMSYIWENGNITFAGLNKLYIATDNLASVTEVIPKNYAGNDYIAANVSTGESYHIITDINTPVYISGTEVLIFGNYCNNNYLAPTQAIYSKDNGLSFKTAYAFGQNPTYKVAGNLVGNPDNVTLARHIHAINYLPGDSAFWMQTGDSTDDGKFTCHWIRGTYDIDTDVWDWTIIASSDHTHRFKSMGMYEKDGYIYWANDSQQTGNYGIWRCLIADMATELSHELVVPDVNTLLGFYMNDSGVMISALSQSYNGVLLSDNFGSDYRRVILDYLTAKIGNRLAVRINSTINGWFRFDPYIANETYQYSGKTGFLKLK